MHSYSQRMIIDTFSTVFLISLYGAPLAQRASYLAQHSSLFGPLAQLIMIILPLCQLAQNVFPMAHALTIVEPIWLTLQNISKNSDSVYQTFNFRQELTTAENIFSFLKTINKLLQNEILMPLVISDALIRYLLIF